MRMLLIDDNTKEFPAYLESMSKFSEPIELLYTDTIRAGLKQIKKGGINLVLLAKPLFLAEVQIHELDPELEVLSIEGPQDKFFLKQL